MRSIIRLLATPFKGWVVHMYFSTLCSKICFAGTFLVRMEDLLLCFRQHPALGWPGESFMSPSSELGVCSIQRFDWAVNVSIRRSAIWLFVAVHKTSPSFSSTWKAFFFLPKTCWGRFSHSYFKPCDSRTSSPVNPKILLEMCKGMLCTGCHCERVSLF